MGAGLVHMLGIQKGRPIYLLPIKSNPFFKFKLVFKSVHYKSEQAVHFLLRYACRVGCYYGHLVKRERIFFNYKMVYGYGISKNKTVRRNNKAK